MVDHTTGSYWMQVSGEAIVGSLTGKRLVALPSQTTTWQLWQQQHPHTFVLSRDTGYQRNYTRDPFANYSDLLNETGRFAFPVSERARDPRLDPGEVVLGVEAGGVQRAYPLERIGDGVINDVMKDRAIVVFSRADGPTGAAYSPLVDGRTLTFTFVDGHFRDEATGSTWNLSGQAMEGELAGTQLEALPSRSTLWFALIASWPEMELYTGE